MMSEIEVVGGTAIERSFCMSMNTDMLNTCRFKIYKQFIILLLFPLQGSCQPG